MLTWFTTAKRELLFLFHPLNLDSISEKSAPISLPHQHFLRLAHNAISDCRDVLCSKYSCPSWEPNIAGSFTPICSNLLTIT